MLEFDIEQVDEQFTRITLTAYWHPAGVWGILYWLVFTPSHFVVFNGMARAIAARAEQAERSKRTDPSEVEYGRDTTGKGVAPQ